MNYINNFKKIMLISGLFLGFSSCVHGPKVQEFSSMANPAKEIANLEVEINMARNNQVNVLSPNNFQKAQDSLEDAKKSLLKKKNSKDTLHMVAVGFAYIDLANDFAVLSHDNMDEVVVSRQKALSAGAQSYFPENFRETDDKLISVTSEIEKNDLDDIAENRSALQAKYLNLELLAIKEANLGQSRKTIDQAINEGAKDFAPRTLAIAEKCYKDAETFITGNRYAERMIEKLSNVTAIKANHVLKITRDSKLGMKTSSEETALLREIDNKMIVDKENKLNEERIANKVLIEDNQDLKVSNVFNRSFEKARVEFSPNEAEVYKKGNTLVIRLKGLKFQSAQAVLTKSNFKLLAKVINVVKDFDNSTVIVEGHTDSIGSKAINKKLSIDRAKAIEEYLVANNAISPYRITAVGYGFQKPLATNKTVAGREKNRRVDVLIKADDSKNY